MNNKTVAILKFFKDKDNLDYLLSGGFYCNTPEFYRMSKNEGVSDVNESCLQSYRSKRGDKPIELRINGEVIEGIDNLTVQNKSLKDRYLHCWFAIRIPETNEDLEEFTRSINRMRSEFGENYAFIRMGNVSTLVKRLGKNTTSKIDYGNVVYSKDPTEWSVACKSTEYSYQQEYRFLVGNCDHTDTKPFEIVCDQRLDDLIDYNQNLEIKNKETGHTLFFLDSTQCYFNIDIE